MPGATFNIDGGNLRVIIKAIVAAVKFNVCVVCACCSGETSREHPLSLRQFGVKQNTLFFIAVN